MRKFYSIFILLLTISTAAFAQNLPLHQFANIYGGPDSSEFPNGFGKDAAGNIYVSGRFSGVNVDFNPGAGSTNTTTNGFYDGYIAKYNSSGVFQWVIQIGGAKDDRLNDITVDAAGTVYATGFFTSDSMDMDPGVGVSKIYKTGTLPSFVAKYSTAGAYLGAFTIAGNRTGEQINVNKIKVNRTGTAFYVTGALVDSIDFDPSAGQFWVAGPTTNANAFIARYSSIGVLTYAGHFGSTGFDIGTALTVDFFDNVFLAGTFDGAFFIPATSQVPNTGAVGTDDIFVTGFISSGGNFGLINAGSAGDDQINGMDFDAFDNLYTTGYFGGAINFDLLGGNTAAQLTPNGNFDAFAVKYDGNFNFIRALKLGGTLEEFGNGIGVDSFGRTLLTGTTQSTNIDFDPSANNAFHSSVGGRDIYVAKYDSMFNYVSSFTVGSSTFHEWGEHVLPIGKYGYISCRIPSTVDFDPSSGTNSLSTTGQWDGVIGKYDMCGTIPNVTVDRILCNGGSFYFKGAVRNTTGSWTDTISRKLSGCDSIVTLNLTILAPVVPTNNVTSSLGTTICPSTGVTFTAAITNGGAFPNYAWKKNGVAVGGNSNTYFTSTLANNDTIYCILTSSDSCANPKVLTSNKVIMTVGTNKAHSVTITASPNSTTICPTTSVTFGASVTNGGANPSYQWKKNLTNVGTNSQTYITNSINNNDSIYCVVTSSDSCSGPKIATSNKFHFTVATNITHSAIVAPSTATTICAGTNVTFTVTPTNGGSNPSYQWKRNNTNVGTNSTSYSTSSLVNGDSVYCMVTSSDSCAGPKTVASNKVGFVVNSSVVPTATIGSTPSGTICQGTNVVFSVSTSNNLGSNPTYNWLKNGVSVGTNPTYASSALAQSDAIKCIIKSTATCAVPDSVITNTINMNVNPTLTPSAVISGNNSICVGQNTTFTVVPTNGGTPVYQWKVDGNPVGTNSSSYSSTTLTNGQVVKCEMTSNATCANPTLATSNSITMQVNSLSAPSVTISGSATNLCSGQSLTFTPSPTNGGSNPTYQWKINGSNSFVGTPYTASFNAGDIITCVMTSNSACASPLIANSNSQTIVAAVTPSITINSPTTSICAGESLTFTASINNGGLNPSFQWFKNGSPVSGQTSNSYTSSSFINGDQVTCQLTSNAICATTTSVGSNTKTITIVGTVVPSVSVSTANTTVCQGANILVTASPGNGGSGPMYQWKVNNVNSGSPTSSNTFNISTLVTGDKVSCTMVSNSACASTPNATSNDLTFTVNTNLVPTVSLSPFPSNTVCSGGSLSCFATPTNGGTSPTYSWTVDAVAQGSTTFQMSKSYVNLGATPIQATVVVTMNTTPGACVTTTSVVSSPVSITINPIVTPSLTISTPNTTVCAGVNTTFTASPTNCGTTPSYQWKINGGNVGTNSPSFSSSTLGNGETVSCVVTPVGGCFTASNAISNLIVMTITPSPTPTVGITTPTNTVCSGDDVVFTANTTNGGTSPIYQWKVNGNNAGTNSSTFNTSTLANQDNVQLTFTSNAACASPAINLSNTLQMTVKPKPAKPSITKLNSTSLQCTVTGGDSYVWKKDGVTSSTTSRTLTITNTIADYTVEIIVNGCSAKSDVYANAITSGIRTFDELGARVFPNPVTDKVFVELPLNILSKNNTIKVMNAAGQVVSSESNIIKTKVGYEINLESVAAGMYLLELENETGKAMYKIQVVK